MTGRVLIADDQPDVLEALRLLLSQYDFTVRLVTSPRALLEQVKAETWDIVLMDLNYSRDTTSGAEGPAGARGSSRGGPRTADRRHDDEEFDEEFDEERLADALRRSRHLDAPGLHAAVLAEVNAFATRGFQDDATLLDVAIK